MIDLTIVVSVFLAISIARCFEWVTIAIVRTYNARQIQKAIDAQNKTNR